MKSKFSLLIIFVIAIISNMVGYLVGSALLLPICPHPPQWVVFFFVFGIFLLLTIPMFKEKYKIPYNNKTKIRIGLFIGALLSSFWIYNTVVGRIYIDNATSEVKEIVYTDRSNEIKRIEIPSGSYKKIEVPVGKIELKINSKIKEILCLPQVDQIFNIDTANSYILTEIVYGNAKNTKQSDPKIEFIKEEFFQSKADYLFEAPESIYQKRTSRDKVKSVLYRMNDLPSE